jgi:diketogulonate reductase-like aldo/keto reductase
MFEIIILTAMSILCVNTEIAPRLLLNDGFKIPIVGLGTGTTTDEAVRDAIEAGYRHIDTSLNYKDSEKTIGKALKDLISEGKIKREELFIVSKLETSDLERSRVSIGIKQSLDNLGLKYLDLYLIHHPQSGVDVLETWRGMEDVHKQGLTKSIGVSNFDEEQIDRILANATVKPVTNQVQCNPYHNQKKLHDYLSKHNITLTAYSPLGGIFGSENLLKDSKLVSIGHKHNVTAAQVALRYQIQRNIIVIPKSVNKKYILENIDLFNFKLTDEDITEIDSLNKIQ